ncbi:hypothetical protein ASPZODRAFT_65245 [Penicilliopsis zonata CBS 506.65]|uniref:Malate dehydrogenase n=1 Tax=Penicilliopsis zonata CBS 506.65 TaxID=1073090 RepID=A0A1L9SJG6_9EURO|nr:hypothetical protein ASPZODRAFT_65245 [Penicilliopsis zonata CBS 506.65]OJJ47251.1 hypothetical protein ASPZODRAFT_65245 [Penicilliopsis zonata CBS 506.65]
MAAAFNNDDLTNVFVRASSVLDDLQVGNCSALEFTLPLSKTSPQLPEPSSGLTLKYATLGRGTQNYTCKASDSSAAPVAIGASATLFDVSCLISKSPSLVDGLPALFSGVSLDAMILYATILGRMASPTSGNLVIGEHYFTASGSPFFDLRFAGHGDYVRAKSLDSVSSPDTGKDSTGSYNVPWLLLGSVDGQGIKEVYRLETSGGAAPTTCQGQDELVEVEYAAAYFFFG